PTSGTRGASHRHSTPRSTPPRATATAATAASRSSVFIPGPSCPYQPSPVGPVCAGFVTSTAGSAVERPAPGAECSCGGGGGVRGALTLTSCQASLCGASSDGGPAVRPGGDGQREDADDPADRQVAQHEGPVGVQIGRASSRETTYI